MKWFKHDSNAASDAKLRRVQIKYGMEGYGLYWYCLELIAGTVEKHNLNFELEHDAEIIAVDTGIHYERVQEMMAYMVELGLFESSRGRITCLKMQSRTDEYTAKIIRDLPNSGQCPDTVGTKSDLIEEKRIEENRREEKRVTARKRAPKDFVVSIEMYEWADAELGLLADQVNAETAAFLDHEFKHARKDWVAVWRNWMRRAKKWSPSGDSDPYFDQLKRGVQ